MEVILKVRNEKKWWERAQCSRCSHSLPVICLCNMIDVQSKYVFCFVTSNVQQFESIDCYPVYIREILPEPPICFMGKTWENPWFPGFRSPRGKSEVRRSGLWQTPDWEIFSTLGPYGMKKYHIYIYIYYIYIYYMYILICMVIHSAGRELPTVWNPYAHAQCAEDAPKTVNHLLGGAASSHVKDGANLKGVSWQQLRSPKSTLVTIVVTTDILGYRGYRGTHSVCVCLNRLNIAILYR